MSNDDSAPSRRKSWIPKIPRPGSSSGRTSTGSNSNGGLSSRSSNGGAKSKESSTSSLATAKEGEESNIGSPRPDTLPASPVSILESFYRPSPASSKPSSIRARTLDSPPLSRPTTPKQRSSSTLLTQSPSSQELDHAASKFIHNALERTTSQPAAQTTSAPKSPEASRHPSSFGKMSFSSMMGGLSSLSLSRTNTREGADDRGRSMFSGRHAKSSSQAPQDVDDNDSRSRSRARSQSPFTLRRFRTREPSPPPQAIPLAQSDAELSEPESSVQPRTAFSYDSGDDTTGDFDGDSDDSFSDEDVFDPITERNTEQNAIIAPNATEVAQAAEVEDPDPVGEGVNVVIAPEPYFPTSLNAMGSSGRGKRTPRRRKSLKTHEPLPLNTSRPIFQRDRCTITIVQGDPESKLADRKKRRYVVASDLSEESRYAVEWGIGTVLRDGDEMLLVSVVENEARIDPPIPNNADRAAKLRSQQERQGMAYILVRQVTGLLQRTRLNVTVSCQAWHAKNARHMLLDVVDYIEPTMLIVGSRGLSHLNGILLGSTSHYLIEKCSVPVMVARRRLKRPPKRVAHLSTHRAHVKLAEAGIDRVAGRVDEDVQVMRDELQKEDQRRDGGPGSRKGLPDYSTAQDEDVVEEDEGDNEEEADDDIHVKVSG